MDFYKNTNAHKNNVNVNVNVNVKWVNFVRFAYENSFGASPSLEIKERYYEYGRKDVQDCYRYKREFKKD